MRYYIIILFLFITISVFGQNKDRLAEMDIKGRVEEISVSLDEKIWIVTYGGDTYFTVNIDSTWHNPNFPHSKTKFDLSNHLDRITWFNKDTAIMTGYISSSSSNNDNKGVFLTYNGGALWKYIDFGGDSWIYYVFTDSQGNAWMGGSSNDIYYSNNYGENWETIKIQTKSEGRSFDIFMIDSKQGILSCANNEFLITYDNWKTAKKIPTPFDQDKTENNGINLGIGSASIWKNYFILSQAGKVFYSDTNVIEWKRFPVDIKFFKKDIVTDYLYVMTCSGELLVFTTPSDYKALSILKFTDIKDVKVVNSSVYLLTKEFDIYKVNKSGIVKKNIYTNDYKIKRPQIIRYSGSLISGANGKNLYLADNKRHNWYRVKRLDFYISDMSIINDSLILLWDGFKDNYLYSLKDNEIKTYFFENPLNDFLLHPLKSISISSGYGVGHVSHDEKINYIKKDDSTFITHKMSIFYSIEQEELQFNNSVNIKLLEDILNSISLNPYEIPSIKDFNITDEDKENFYSLVEEQIKKNSPDYLSRIVDIDKAFYYSIPDNIDTISNSIIDNIINHKEVGWSSARHWFNIVIYNQNNDSLNISRKYSIRTLPWNLPWIIEYRGFKFNCYNIEFSRYINSCIPENYYYKEAFDNKYLIMSIANYLWNEKNKTKYCCQ